ncbi:hypothetical protein PV327_007491 [Microctonus hyperodae]|uniref:RNase NYN domain-containing protein n=2 Tax=Microctonus hyperodae TaxID=165561 RepID=A0AA39KYI3_MICHY|nr:hypothetical protein PV327_007491 [Microctonus hyperodae]
MVYFITMRNFCLNFSKICYISPAQIQSHIRGKHYINQLNKRVSMRDRMSTYLGNLGRMSSLNDSVIICDPTPEKRGIPSRIIQRGKKTKCQSDKVNDSKNKNLSNSGLRVPLRTVYESPLGRGKRNICNNNPSVVVNVAAKRFRKNKDISKSPPKKKQKTHHETIIILSDDESGPSKQSSEPDIILVDDKKKSPVKKTLKPMAKSKKQIKKERKVKRMKQQTNLQNRKNNIGDDEDIAVVWSSTDDNGKNQRVDEKKIKSDSRKDIFFIDTAGDRSNYDRQSLIDNSICPSKKKTKNKPKDNSKNKLREIVVDGCNVAFGYSRQSSFSKMGLKLVLDYFHNRGHTVKIFLPQHQRKRGREYLEQWYRQGCVIFTPSRNIGGKNIIPYDDRFIVDYATKCNGIIVTSDQYRDLWQEKPEWRETIEKRLITPTFAGNYVMFPEDPLGRGGPKLDQFLKY